MKPPFRITVRDGLGGRVAAIANALSTGRQVAFGWEINDQCPLPCDEVFPSGIPGVTFTEPDGDAPLTPWNAQPIFAWDAAASRPTANQAYARIMAAMFGTPWTACGLGVVARFFRGMATPLSALAAHISVTAAALDLTRVFILADSRRAELAAMLPHLAINFPRCPELTSDLDRTPAATRAFIADWKTLLACPVIAVPDGPTTILHPARAAGREIRYPA